MGTDIEGQSVYATSLYPGMFLSIGCGLLRAELCPFPARLTRRHAGFRILKTDLLFSQV